MTPESAPEDRTIDMSRVCDLINAAGFYAYVEQTGGGCATIYAYRSASYPERSSGPWADVMAGPGSYDWDGTNHTAYYGEFSWGRTATDAARIEDLGEDDEYTTDHDGLDDNVDDEHLVSHEEIAERIVALLRTARDEYGPRSDIEIVRHAFVPAADPQRGNLYHAEYTCQACGRDTDLTSIHPITTLLCIDCEIATERGDQARLAFLKQRATEARANRERLIAEGKLQTYASKTFCKVCGYRYEKPGQHL
jgi:hypothetical protein